MPEAKQSTLKTRATMSGPGLHTGAQCGIALCPAAVDSGVVFATREGEVRAAIDNVQDTHRGTSLRSGDGEVRTVEHLLAALAGMGVDNVRVEVDGPEVPAGDGSALPFVELIEGAGIEEQATDARAIRLEEPVWVARNGGYLLAVPGPGFKASALMSFRHPMIGEQAISLVIDPATFKREIAPARTFCAADEIEAILSQGLGRGGSEDNVIVVYDDRCSVPLRFENEFVRHKLLDLVGDLSLIGRRLYADVTAIKMSHALNVALAGQIMRTEASGWQGG